MIQPQGTPAGPSTIDVTYTIEEGNRSFVQRINIVGNTRTKDKVIRREVLIAPGDIFNTVRVETTKKRLDNLGYFSKVETYPEDTGVTGARISIIQVEEKRTGSLNFGAGFSTIDNLVGFVEMTQGNFDLLNWPNFTGGGQKFRLRIQYGTQRKDFILSLTEPYFLDRRLSLGGEIFYREANFLSVDYDQRNYGFSIEARKPFRRFTSVSLEYRAARRVDIFNVAPRALPRKSRARRASNFRARSARPGSSTPATIRFSAAAGNASSSPLMSPADFWAATSRPTDLISRRRSIFHLPYDHDPRSSMGAIAAWISTGASGNATCRFSTGSFSAAQ